jgi:hypothetical protein
LTSDKLPAESLLDNKCYSVLLKSPTDSGEDPILAVVGVKYVLAPHMEVYRVLKKTANAPRRKLSGEIEALGGETEALRKILRYRSFPKWATPYREWSVFLMGACGSQAVQYLGNALKQGNVHERAFAASGLGSVGATDILRESLLFEKDDEVVCCILEGLELTDDIKAIEFVENISGDLSRSPRIRSKAKSVLKWLNKVKERKRFEEEYAAFLRKDKRKDKPTKDCRPVHVRAIPPVVGVKGTEDTRNGQKPGK